MYSDRKESDREHHTLVYTARLGIVIALVWLLVASGAVLGNAAALGATQQTVRPHKPFTWRGEVQTYEPAKLITIRKLKTQETKFDLTKDSVTYTIDAGVRRGSRVEVTEEDLGNGKR
ncbi:MAG: hypothetical protein JOZ62_06470, partial [Acidobacteriaceae bacterium]|nr:hypothetical protein [Acidobacteriaceae bacterium]